MVRDPVTRFLRNHKKTRDFGHLWPFSWPIAHGFGARRGFNWFRTHQSIFTKSYKTRDFGHLWPFPWPIAHRFGVRRGSKRFGTPSHDFHEIIKKLVISGISRRFRGL